MSSLRSVGATKGLAQEFLYWMDGWINVFSLAALNARRFEPVWSISDGEFL